MWIYSLDKWLWPFLMAIVWVPRFKISWAHVETLLRSHLKLHNATIIVLRL